MAERLLRVCVCMAAVLLAASWCARAIGLANDCGRYTSCEECHKSATCAWCATNSSSVPRCVSLSAPLPTNARCWPSCGERSRTARDAGGCDDSACLGVEDQPCSNRGTCNCGTCTCEPGYTGRACQNCPTQWDDCPGSSRCCQEVTSQCLQWPSTCARCMRSEQNATLCDTCPRDTLIVRSDPRQPRSAECAFSSFSLSSDRHCSYHVYFWRDDTAVLALHARVQLICASAASRAIFHRRKESGKAVPSDASPTPAAATTGAPFETSPARPGGLPERRRQKTAEENSGATERPEGAAKQPSGAGAAELSRAAVLLCWLWTVWRLR